MDLFWAVFTWTFGIASGLGASFALTMSAIIGVLYAVYWYRTWGFRQQEREILEARKALDAVVAEVDRREAARTMEQMKEKP